MLHLCNTLLVLTASLWMASICPSALWRRSCVVLCSRTSPSIRAVIVQGGRCKSVQCTTHGSNRPQSASCVLALGCNLSPPHSFFRLLRTHETRIWVFADILPWEHQHTLHGRARRAAVRDTTRDNTWLVVRWNGPHKILHKFLDMGPRSWAVRAAVYTTFCIRGTYSHDPCHRRHVTFLLAVGLAGLDLLRLECGVVYTFSAGPWHGDAWHRTMRDAVK